MPLFLDPLIKLIHREKRIDPMSSAEIPGPLATAASET